MSSVHPAGDFPESRPPLRLAKAIVRLALTVAVLVLLLRLVEVESLWQVLVRAEWRLLGLVLVLRAAIYLVRGARFWQLQRASSSRSIGFWPTVSWYFVSLNLGVFTPAGLGEFSLLYFMKRRGLAAADVFVAMALDKVVTVGVLAFMGLTAATLFLELPKVWWIVALMGLTVFVLIAWMSRRTLQRLSDRPTGVAGEVARTLLAAAAFSWSHPWAVLFNTFAAVVQSVLFSAQIWICFRMFSFDVDFAGVFWLSSIGRIVNLVPVTIGGLGVYEGSMVLVLAELGATADASLAAVFIPRAIGWVVAGVVVFAAIWGVIPVRGGESS